MIYNYLDGMANELELFTVEQLEDLVGELVAAKLDALEIAYQQGLSAAKGAECPYKQYDLRDAWLHGKRGK